MENPAGAEAATKLPPSASVKPLSLPDNLLDLTRQKEVEILARVLIVASISGGQDDVVRKLDSLVANKGVISGIGMVLRQTCMLFCEGESEQMRRMVVSLQESSRPLEDIRVAAFCDDVPSRTFKDYSTFKANIPKESNVSLPDEGIASFVFDVFQKCTLLGAEIGKQNKAKANASLAEKQPTLFPSHERLIIIATSDDLMRIDDFFELHGKPIRPESLSDSIWPMQDIAVDLQL